MVEVEVVVAVVPLAAMMIMRLGSIIKDKNILIILVVFILVRSTDDDVTRIIVLAVFSLIHLLWWLLESVRKVKRLSWATDYSDHPDPTYTTHHKPL
jgi:hypothetical protein